MRGIQPFDNEVTLPEENGRTGIWVGWDGEWTWTGKGFVEWLRRLTCTLFMIVVAIDL
jgi:hypothetical protein